MRSSPSDLLVLLSAWRFGSDWAVWWREIVPQPLAFLLLYAVTLGPGPDGERPLSTAGEMVASQRSGRGHTGNRRHGAGHAERPVPVPPSGRQPRLLLLASSRRKHWPRSSSGLCSARCWSGTAGRDTTSGSYSCSALDRAARPSPQSLRAIASSVFESIGFLTTPSRSSRHAAAGRVLGSLDDLEAVLHSQVVDEVADLPPLLAMGSHRRDRSVCAKRRARSSAFRWT